MKYLQYRLIGCCYLCQLRSKDGRSIIAHLRWLCLSSTWKRGRVPDGLLLARYALKKAIAASAASFLHEVSKNADRPLSGRYLHLPFYCTDINGNLITVAERQTCQQCFGSDFQARAYKSGELSGRFSNKLKGDLGFTIRQFSSL